MLSAFTVILRLFCAVFSLLSILLRSVFLRLHTVRIIAVLLALTLLPITGCGKKEKIENSRDLFQVSNSDKVLDPRFSIFLSKAYFAVASRRDATNRIKLIKKGRRAERGDVVAPEVVERGRHLSPSEVEWIQQQRKRLNALLATTVGENTAVYANAALAQANFDCWYFEMYKKSSLARDSHCGLDLAAALGASNTGTGFRTFGNLPSIEGQVNVARRQRLATGQQFSTLQKYLQKSDVDTLLMFLQEDNQDMQGVVERLVERQLKKDNEGSSLPSWRIIFKGKKRKLSKDGKRTVKQIIDWYKRQQQSVTIRIKYSGIDNERGETVVSALVKKGVGESAIVRDITPRENLGDSSVGEIIVHIQRSAQP